MTIRPEGLLSEVKGYEGLPGGSVVKNSPANAGDIRDACRLHPWVGKFPWRKAWQLTPVFLPEESHGQRSLVGYSPWSHKESDTTEQLSTHLNPNLLFIPPPRIFSFFGHAIWRVESSSLTRDRTCVPCTGGAEPSPRDCQGSPVLNFLLDFFFFSPAILMLKGDPIISVLCTLLPRNWNCD